MPMKKDSLDSCSVHSRSSHTKDEFTSVTVRKSDPKQKSGIKLEQEENTLRIKVTNIATNGLFANSEIEIGDILLSVNAKRLKKGEGPEKFVEAIKKAKTVVTLVVKKSYIKPRVAPKKKAKSLIQDNNVTKSKDSYYKGIAQHNADGSLNFDACKVKKKGSSSSSSSHGGNKPKPKKKVVAKTEISTITASKVSGRKFIHGLEFEVKKSALYLKSMDVESAFLNTDLEVGDKILSINDMNFRSYADANYAEVIIEKAKDNVTLVVEKKVVVISKKSGGGKSLFRKKRSSTTSTASSVSSSMSDDSTFLTDSSTATSDDDDDDDDDDDASFGALDDDEMILPVKKSTSSSSSSKKPKIKEVTISAPKAYFTQDPGITFRLGDPIGKMGKYGRQLIVSRIDEDSMFYNTSLEEGDVIVAVNGETFPDFNSDGSQGGNKVERACLACSNAKESIALLVAKQIIPQSQLLLQGSFNLDASATNLNWQ